MTYQFHFISSNLSDRNSPMNVKKYIHIYIRMVDGTIFNIQNYKVTCLPRVNLLKLKFISTVNAAIKKSRSTCLDTESFQ